MSVCHLLSIVVPCFNEEEIINFTFIKINNLAKDWLARQLIKDFELIFVDDGSKDHTLEILIQLAKTDKRLKIISFSRNFGHQAALCAGLYRARGDAIVSLDADLQDPPEIIPEMLNKYSVGFEIILGVRKERKGDGFFKKITAQLFYKSMNLMGANLIYNHADFRLISGRALAELKKFPESMLFLRGLIPSLGFNQSLIYYDRTERTGGKSKYSLGKMMGLALEGVTSFTYLPLRLASIAGIIIALASLLLSLWAVIITLLGKSVPGWASTVLPLYFLGGIQLLFFGIMGEYIGKIYMETKKRPPFIVKEEHNF